MIEKVLLFVTFLLFISQHSVLSLKCFLSPVPYVLNYSVTIDTLPSFANNLIADASGECTLTLMWLRNPSSSMIIFGFNNENTNQTDSILATVQYQLEGEELLKHLSYDVQLKCQSNDECNNENNLRRLLKSMEIEERFEGQFDNLIASNQSFNNESIKNCYLNRNSSVECPSIDYSNCHRCQISVNYLPSSIIDVCATCPTMSKENNFLVRDKIFILTNRSKIIDRIELSCQNGEHCNSIENIEEIRKYSLIDFDFDEYFSSSCSHIFLSIEIIFMFIIMILF